MRQNSLTSALIKWGPPLLACMLAISMIAGPVQAVTHTSILPKPPARPSLQAASTGSWASTGSLAIKRVNHTATLLPDGGVLVVGGNDSGSAGLNAVEIFNPASGTWVLAAPMTTARYYHTATLLPNGKVLVTGGANVAGPLEPGPALANVEIYDPKTGKWTLTTSMHTPRARHTATLLPSGKVLVAGGYANTGVALASAEVFDPVREQWTQIPDMLSARRGHTATLLPNGTVLVAGGRGAEVLSNVESYDPRTNQWTTTTSMFVARTEHTATLLTSGDVLVAGGASNNTMAITGTEIFSPATGQWRQLPNGLTTARSRHTATLLPNGSVLVTGGIDQGNNPLASTEIYRPSNGQWAPISSTIQFARYYHTATLLPNGNVLIAGGNNFNTSFDSTKLYSDATGSWSSAGVLANARRKHTATLLPDGRVLVAGGYNDTNADSEGGLPSYSTTQLYNPTASNSWVAGASMHSARDNHTATLLSDGQVLVAGGRKNNISLTTAELYNSTVNAWSLLPDMGEARSMHTATLLRDGRVLLAGGYDGVNALKTAIIYDPIKKSWTPTGSLRTARLRHTATLLPSGLVLVTGGTSQPSNIDAFNSAELYNPTTGIWSDAAPMGASRNLHTATLLVNGQALIIGGVDASKALASAEIYDPLHNLWTPTPTQPALSRFWHMATLLGDGRVLVAGGENGDYVPDAEIFDPSSGLWQGGGILAAPRSDYTMTLLPDGDVFVAGGFNATREQSSAEVLNTGLGYEDAWRPVIDSVTSPLHPSQQLIVQGHGFQGISEGSSGNVASSPTNYPLLQLRSLSNEQTEWLAPSGWSSDIFTATLDNTLPSGNAMATIFVNGIPSLSRMIQIESGATWYVAPSGNDANDCQTLASACQTISAAIRKAANGHTIIIAPGTYTENITLDRSLSLIGADAATTIIDGKASGRTIMINADVSAAISGVTIRNGKLSGSGGSFGGAGIYNSGILSLVNSVVRDNISGSFAGGIYNDRSRTMTLTNVQVLNNKVTPLDNVVGNRNGGGIVNSGSMTVTDSLIQSNSADLGTLVGAVMDSVGGGIFNDGNSQLILANSKVLSNTTTTTPGGRSAEGAGIQNYGQATLNHSVIQGNIARGIAAAGGGLYNVASSVVLVDSTVRNNLAQSINGTGLSAHGGGIQNDAALTLRQSFVSGNIANGDNSPGTEVRGGGINNDASLTLINSTINNNTARDGAASVHGGGIASSTPSSTLLITESLISDNTTVGVADSLGGGIYNCAALKIDRSSIHRNHARGIGGGAGLYECGHSDITSSTFSENISDSGGGAIANAGFMTLTNSTISGNQVLGSSGNGTGGGIANASGDLAIRNTTITNNTAPFGGGIAYTNRSLLLANTILAGNHATSGPDCLGSLSSQGYNLIGNLSGCTLSQVSTDQVSLTGVLDPRLGPLASNGGSTQTHALLPGSSAIDAIPSGCLSADQRGVTRPQGSGCDIGAYEAPSATSLAFSAQPDSAEVSKTFSIQPVVITTDPTGIGAGFNGIITLSLISKVPGAQLLGTKSLPAKNGRAMFTDLSVDKAGSSYQLEAQANGVATAISRPFDVLLPAQVDPLLEIEPNNLITETNPLLFDINNTATRTGFISATLGFTTDLDLYSFDVAPNTKVNIRLTDFSGKPNQLPANYDLLLLPASAVDFADGNLDLNNVVDFARNFIARNFIARNFIARNFIARNFIGEAMGSISDKGGRDDESIETILPNGGTYILVVYGATEQDTNSKAMYRLQVTRKPGNLTLPPIVAHPVNGLLHGGLPAQPDPSVRTIYIYNSARMHDLYQTPEEQQARLELTTVLTSSNSLMDAGPAGKGKGIAIDLSTALQTTDATTMTALYNQWQGAFNEDQGVAARTNPLFANEIAREIRYVLSYALTSVYTGTTDIVLVGGDAIIPFYRIPDEETFANENEYANQLRNTDLLTDTALYGSMIYSFIQTDNFYATSKPIFWRNRGLYVPNLGIGRLVERPSEIMHYLQGYLESSSPDRFTIDAQYQSPPAAGAAFVTGSGFLTDQADALSEQFAQYGLKNDTNVTSTLGLTYTLNVLNNDQWDLRQFTDLWLSGQLPRLSAATTYSNAQTRYDLSALNSHFSHYGADPAIGDTATFSAEQLLDLISGSDATAFFRKDGRPTLIYSVGCHSGLSATDQAFSTPFYQADFPQAVLKQGGNWIGNTGFGIGETDRVGYSERLSLLFTRAIGRTITDTLEQKYIGASIGESLAQAKWDYLPKGAGSFNVYDEKVVEQMVLYGLPFLRVKVPRPTPPPPPLPKPQIWENLVDASGIFTRLITLDNTFNQLTTSSGDNIPRVSSSVQDSFRSNEAPTIHIEDRLTNSQPVLPLLRYDITLQPSKPGLGLPIPRTVRLIAATTSIVANYDPHVTTITTDTFAQLREPPLSPRKTWLPALPFTFLQTVQRPGATDVITTDNLLVTPAQFNAQNSKRGTLRQYSHIVIEITYVVPGYSAAISRQGPQINRAEISAPNRQGTARLRATVLAGELGLPPQVNAFYTVDGISWQRTTLTLVSRRSGRYEARIPAKRGSAIYAFFEARDRYGNSSTVSAQR